MLLGFADKHASKCYRLLNPETKQVMISRDVTCLDKSFGDWTNVQDLVIVPLATEVIDTFNEDYEMDAPNLIPPDDVSDDKMIDDYDTCQGDDF